MNVLDCFLGHVGQMLAPRVLELGTKQARPGTSTMHKDWVPHASEYLGTDFEPGLEVDIVADLHNLSSVAGASSFDVIVSCSTLEHIKYPWIAAMELAKVLRPDGVIFVQTHHTFPLHFFPFDYWRFSNEALLAIFNRTIGFETLATDYEFPCQINSDQFPESGFVSYLNSRICARRNHPVPECWLPDGNL